MKVRPLVYYVSAHGYGHGVRSSDIIRQFTARCPDIPVIVVSGLDTDFFRSRLASPAVSVRQAAFDVGMVQIDSIRVDLPATRERICAIYDRRRELLEEEAGFLRAREAGLVVADIPALPLAAAARAGVRRMAVGNFTWDWIYSAFVDRDPAWGRVAAMMREDYAHAERLLRLPFSGDTAPFRHVEDLPLLADPGQNRRTQLADAVGVSAAKIWILLSFAALSWDEAALRRIKELDDFEFFGLAPLDLAAPNYHLVDRHRFPFRDVVASVDAVVSKPGYGILSECIANDKPLLYAERRDFIEYPVLVRAIRRYLRHVFIPEGPFYRGELAEYLGALPALPAPPETMARGGAEVAARRMAETMAR